MKSQFEKIIEHIKKIDEMETQENRFKIINRYIKVASIIISLIVIFLPKHFFN